jgi:hypothetical protein
MPRARKKQRHDERSFEIKPMWMGDSHEPAGTTEYKLSSHIYGDDLDFDPDALDFLNGISSFVDGGFRELFHKVEGVDGVRWSGYFAGNAKGSWLKYYTEEIPGSDSLMGLVDHIMRSFEMPQDARRCFAKMFM